MTGPQWGPEPVRKGSGATLPPPGEDPGASGCAVAAWGCQGFRRCASSSPGGRRSGRGRGSLRSLPPNGGAFHGHDGLRRWFQDFAEAFEDIHFEVLDYTALDAQRVLTKIRSQGHFRETGLPIDLRWVCMSSVRNGKVVHAAGYLSAREALKAVGLEE